MGVAIPQIVSEDRASGAQIVDGGLKFDSSKSHYLSRTPGSAGNRRKFTHSFWVKRAALGSQKTIFSGNTASNFNTGWQIAFRNEDTLDIGGTSPALSLVTNQLFRDVSAWYHIVVSTDTTQSTPSDRVKLYVNGTRVTDFGTETYPSQDADLNCNGNFLHRISGLGYTSSVDLDAYLADIHFIDGQALGPGYFGYTDPLTGTWRPRKRAKQGAPTVNNGTTWSSFLTPGSTVRSGFPASRLFDGSVGFSNAVATTDSVDGTYIEFDFSSIGGIPFQTIEYSYEKNGQNNMILTFNGVRQDYTTNYTYNSWNYRTVTGLEPGRLFNIKIDKNGDSGSSYFAGIKIDGVTMIDGNTTTVDFGTNGFYLPFDGSAPIGQDQSGQGNDWTPVNFGGSNTLEKATGALPILNTDGGGKVARVGTRTDAYYDSLVLAIPGAGNLNDVHADIKGSGTNKTVTNAGSIAFSNTNNNFYSNSIYSAGSTNQYFTVGSSTESDFNMTGDFTIEFWHYPVTSGYSVHARAFYFGTSDGNSGGQFVFYSNDIDISSATDGLFNGTPFYGIVNHKFDQWNHHAITREGNTLRYFQNGVLLEENTQTTPTGIASGKRTLYIGGSSYMTPQYWQDFRIYNGVAKYTSNFIPASTNPDILPDTPSGVSYSSNVTKITDGAVAFDGSGDYLLGGTSSDYNLGTGDFTIEGYIYPTNASGTQGIMGIGNAVSPACQIFYNVSNSQKVRFNVTDGTAIESTGTAPVNAWSHFAVVREGTGTNETKIYINGKLEAQGTISTNLTETTLQIGRPHTSSGTEYFNGFISNFRVIKGTALYTSNFTPPSAPLTDVTNTKLLCCQSNTSAGAAAVSPNISGINDGTVWSANVSASTGTIVDAGLGFDGSTSTAAYASSSASDTYIYIDFSTALSGTFKLWTGMASGSRTATVTHSGGTSVVNLSSGENSLGTFTSVSRIAVNRGEAATHSFQAIAVDDVVLVDPVTANGNASATNFNPFTTDINAVRGQESGYCTMNPLLKASSPTLSDGNLKITWSSDGNGVGVAANMALNMGRPGKYYWEAFHSHGTGGGCLFGIQRADVTNWTDGAIGTRPYNTDKFAGIFADSSGTFRCQKDGDADVSGYVTPTGNNGFKTFMFCLDTEAGKFWVGSDGVWGNNGGIGNPALGTNPGTANLFSDAQYSYYPFLLGSTDSGTAVSQVNFGQKPFKYIPPAGFQPLNSANVRPTTVIARPDQYVGIVTYTGNGSTQTISGLGFSPDLVWIKNRTDNGSSHALFDVVRGTDKRLRSNGPDEELSPAIYGSLTAFNSNGFTVAPGSSDSIETSTSTKNYVAWTWKAGHPSTPTTGAVSFDGSGDCLVLSDHADLRFGTNNYTVECFVYFNSFDDTYPSIISKYTGATVSWILRVKNDGKVIWYTPTGGGTNNESSTTPIGLKRWIHIAVVREGTGSNETKVYVNGQLELTITDANNYTDTQDLVIGAQNTSDANVLNGFMSNVHVVNGTALYTSNFTPPSTELTSVTNTKLLCCQSPTSAGAAAVSPNISGINDGTVWSSYISGNVHATNNAENTFDGDTNTRSIGASAGDVVTFTPPTTISISSGLRVFLWKNTSGDSWGTFTINGSTVDLNSLGATHGAWYDFGTTYNSSGLTSMSWENDNGSNIDVRVAAIEIDGTVLVDPVTVRGDAAATTYNPLDAFSVDGTGYSTASAAGLTDGTITPTGASVNTKSGFSIVKFNSGTTGGNRTISHGLNNAPSFIIMKSTNAAYNWDIYHRGISNSKDGRLIFTSAAFTTAQVPFGGVDPTSSVFTFNQTFYGNNIDTVAYCWAEIPGFSKFGSYTGNGLADGPVVITGFRPAVVLIKNITTGGTNYDWVLYDSERGKYNPNDKFLCPNLSYAENVRGDNTSDNARYVDFLSNGFKIRNDSSPLNLSNNTIIYAAFAEAPSINLYGAQANAR